MKSKTTRRIVRYLIIISIALAAIYALMWIVLQGYSATWTGFGDYTKPSSDFMRGKTLWDWLQLFIIPIALSIGVFFLNRAERNNEREMATERQREAALQSYLDKMTDLLLREKLLTTENEEVRNVARIRTLTVLRGLDAVRKGMVVQFLSEAKLITGAKCVVELYEADLQGANLPFAHLEGTDLRFASLHGANLASAHLNGANLPASDLEGADLRDADLRGANLSDALLIDANLINANLEGANLQRAILEGAILIQATLVDANLINANLKGANLRGAIVKGTELGVAIITKRQLATVSSLEGASMPDGRKHK